MILRAVTRALLACFIASTFGASRLHAATFGVYGDSLSWQYSLWVPKSTSIGYPLFSNGTQFNWVDHLVKSGYNFGPLINNTAFGISGKYNAYDVALGGAASGDLAAQVQALKPVVTSGTVDIVVEMIGGNDFTIGGYDDIYNRGTSPAFNPLTDPTTVAFINNAVENLLSGANATRAANPSVGLILATVPDIGITPNFITSYPTAWRRDDVTAVVQAINSQIIDYAAVNHIPVIDVDALSALASTPWSFGGVSMINNGGNTGRHVFLSDKFHIGTVPQGLIANAVLLATKLAYGEDVTFISDQTILTRAGVTPPASPGPTYFDVSPYVIYNAVPEVSSLVMVGMGVAISLGMMRIRRK